MSFYQSGRFAGRRLEVHHCSSPPVAVCRKLFALAVVIIVAGRRKLASVFNPYRWFSCWPLFAVMIAHFHGRTPPRQHRNECFIETSGAGAGRPRWRARWGQFERAWESVFRLPACLHIACAACIEDRPGWIAARGRRSVRRRAHVARLHEALQAASETPNPGLQHSG